MGRKKRARPPLDERHYLAIELLTTVPTPNLDDIAQACTIDRRTLYRWRQRKDFDKEMRKVSRRKMEARRPRIKRRPLPTTVDGIERLFIDCGFM
ncbi:phBC6A51 family helix-turn-helix protein [Paenibacillus sp. Marseille-Q9583]